MSDFTSQIDTTTPPEHYGLAAITQNRLAQFRQRRILLQCLQGAATSLIVCVACMLVAALLDALVDHSLARWTGSLLVYGATVLVLTFQCIRPYHQATELRQEAAALEAAEPGLRNHLLSAVELSEPRTGAGDSLAFRQQLQSQVARLIEPVDVRKALPTSRLRTSLAYAAMLSVVFGLLCTIPALRLPHRLARTFFPWSNLGRVSSIAILVEQPSPQSKLIPLDDLVAIRAGIDGPCDEVWLETRQPDGILRTRMQPLSLSAMPAAGNSVLRYESTLTAVLPALDYRVTARGARSPWYRLTTAPRPKVDQFEKRIQPPEYALGPGTVELADHGDLQALQGSTVELRFQVNQPVSLAELHWQARASEDMQITQLAWDSDLGCYSVKFPIAESGSYRIALQSEATGFRNEYSPRHTVTAIPDMPPEVVWVQPELDLLAAGTNELLTLAARVSDELPLDTIQQWLRVQDGAWEMTGLHGTGDETELSMKVDWQLDLQPLQLSAGEAVELKVVATDRRGARAESNLLRIMISSTSIDLRPSPIELARLEIARDLHRLSEKLRVYKDQLSDLAADEGQPLDDAAEQFRLASQSVLTALSAELPPVLERTQQALSLATTQVDCKEMRLLSDYLVQTLTAGLQELTEVIRLPAVTDASQVQKRSRRVDRLTSQVISLAGHARTISTHDIARRHIGQLASLAKAQTELSEATNADAEQLTRQQQVLHEQLGQIQESMFASLDDVQELSRKRWRESAERQGSLVDQLERQMGNVSSERLRALMTASARSLDESRLMARIDGNIYESLKKTHKWLDDNVVPAGTLLGNISHNLNKLGPDNPESQAALSVGLQQLQARRQHARASLLGDPTWASDLGLAKRGLQTLFQDGATQRELAESLEQARRAVNVLGAAAELRTTIAELRETLQRERWSLDTLQATTLSPRGWDSFTRQLEQTLSTSRLAGLPGEWLHRLDRLRWNNATRQAGDSLTARRWERDQPTSAALPLQELVAQLRQLQAELQPHEVEARAKLRELAPSITELARRAASQTRQVSQQTAELSDRVERGDVTNPAPEMHQLSQQVEQLQAPMQRLREALVDEADAQYLLDQQQVALAARADAALAMVDRIRQQTSRSLDEVPTAVDVAPSETSQAQATALAQAAVSQADAATALDEIARFLAQAASASEPSSADGSRAEQSESDLMPAASAAYAEADRLAQLAQTNPEDVLRALEQQLPQNKPMQQEMSAIAQSAAAEALDGLQRAAQQQAQLTPALERSDPSLRESKALLTHDLRTIHDDASQLLSTLLSEAKATAIAGRAGSAEQALRKTQADLTQAVQGNQPLNADASWDALLNAAEQLRRAIETASKQIDPVRQELKKQQTVAIHDNGASLNNRRREMRDRGRRVFQLDVRNLQQAERAQQQRLRQVENENRQMKQTLNKENQQLEQLATRLDKNPEQTSLQQEIQQHRQRIALRTSALAANEQALEEMTRRVQAAAEAVQQANRRQASKLESVNPSVELSERLLAIAHERSTSLANRLQTWSSRAEPNTQAAQDELRSATERQRDITAQVDSAADTLSRAARHERRLGNQVSEQELANIATQVAQQVAGPLAQAELQLRQAQSEAENTESKTGQSSPAATASAVAATVAGEQAISQSVQALRELLQAAKTSPPAATASPSASSALAGPESQSAGSPADTATTLTPQQMAQLLDELDRQLNAQPASDSALPQASLGAQDNNASNPANEGQAANVSETLAEAARKLAARLSRNRESPPSSGNQDIGMATESQVANVAPQPAAAVKVLDVARDGQAWGELRRQPVEGATETQRPLLAPQYRGQVEAYFKNLSMQGRGTVDER